MGHIYLHKDLVKMSYQYCQNMNLKFQHFFCGGRGDNKNIKFRFLNFHKSILMINTMTPLNESSLKCLGEKYFLF